jgi:hypothetical protein
MTNKLIAQIDQARTAPLGRWRVAVCIEEDGHESFWLLAPDPTGEPGCACRTCAPHEWLEPRSTR